jgi:hypothetical protein
VVHPSLVGLDHLEILDDHFHGTPAREVFGYEPGWELPSAQDRAQAAQLMAGGQAQAA